MRNLLFLTNIIKDSFSSLIPFSPTKLNPFGAIKRGTIPREESTD